jgi:hypothetical protein
MATTFGRVPSFAGGPSPGQCFTNAAEPKSPDSSPENAAITTSRRSSPRRADSERAISSRAATPDALSSAPGCTARSWGASECRPPSPR